LHRKNEADQAKALSAAVTTATENCWKLQAATLTAVTTDFENAAHGLINIPQVKRQIKRLPDVSFYPSQRDTPSENFVKGVMVRHEALAKAQPERYFRVTKGVGTGMYFVLCRVIKCYH
jgi:hypothetical protein